VGCDRGRWPVVCCCRGNRGLDVENAPVVDHWLAVHTGTVNEPGPYYGFWSGFGSDIAEFGIIGTNGTGV
jgi:hypothetical protein